MAGLVTAPVSSLSREASRAYVVDSERRASGGQFQPTSEQRLSWVLVQAAEDAHERGDLVAIREFVGPYGIADLAAVDLDTGSFAARRDSGVPPLLSEVDATIVANLSPRYGRSPVELASRLGWSDDGLKRRLVSLVRVGAVLERGGNVYRHTALRPVGRVHALEAKIRDWSKARRQGLTYALWADRSTVVLGAAPRDRRNVEEAFKPTRLGLVVGPEWIRRPQYGGLASTRRLWTSEFVVAALVGPAGA